MNAPRRNQDPERIRFERVNAGLSQKALADRAGISKSHMSQIEGGKAGASAKTLMKLATALGCTSERLMPRDQVPA